MENQSPSIIEFVNRLVEEKNLSIDDTEVLTQIKMDLLDRVEDRINATILEKMPPEKLESFNNLLDQSSEEEIQAFCVENIPNLDEVIAKALVEFKDTYLNS
jgi:hypothetical protein